MKINLEVKSQPIANEKGDSLIMVMMVMSMILILFASMSSMWTSITMQSAQANVRVSGAIVRSNMWAHMQNMTAWAAVQADTTCNANFACLASGPGCAASTPIPTTFAINCLYDAAGVKIFDGSLASSGFDFAGLPCNTYNAPNGSATCSFRPVVSFFCTGSTPCHTADSITVRVAFEFNNIIRTPMNMDKYLIEVVK